MSFKALETFILRTIHNLKAAFFNRDKLLGKVTIISFYVTMTEFVRNCDHCGLCMTLNSQGLSLFVLHLQENFVQLRLTSMDKNTKSWITTKYPTYLLSGGGCRVSS
jgi:hypothetical protein